MPKREKTDHTMAKREKTDHTMAKREKSTFSKQKSRDFNLRYDSILGPLVLLLTKL
jgi:hypothetical protein